MKNPLPLLSLFLLCACSGKVRDAECLPDIFPDYIGVTVPEGMAPLRFTMADGRPCRVSSVRDADTLKVTVTSGGVRYRPFPIYYSHDPIDPYVAYRLIEPGYESWNHLGIWQRDLGSFRETLVAGNRYTGKACLNCHTFNPDGSGDMIFHVRGKNGGTIFSLSGETARKDLSKTGVQRQGTYPAWHPGGRFVVFSSNRTKQHFLISSSQPIEVYDTASDIIIMDLESGETSMVVETEDTLETFPSWSEDGRTLYYCAAPAIEDIGANRGKVRYSLMALDFDGEKFCGSPRKVWGNDSLSVSFPRRHGDYILFTGSAFGTFPIWHKEADLYMLDLRTGDVRAASEINSDDTESYHSWSSNGSWIVFSSRRLDGRYTRLYIAHYDGEGHFDKPFLLPQKSPARNTFRLQSYNVPEFVRTEIPCKDRELRKMFR